MQTSSICGCCKAMISILINYYYQSTMNQKRLRKIVGVCLLMLSVNLTFAQKFTLSGYIKDASNGEELIGASVYLVELKTGAVTNEYGFYSVKVDKGQYTVKISYIGYQTITKNINLDKDQKLDIELPLEGKALEEIVVTSSKPDENIRSIQMSVNKLEMKTIQKIPAFFGEADVIRSIQLLPGVTTVGEGASGFNVRGGNIDQNLILIDEAPVYNSAHALGFFSVFNPDAVKNVKLVKGGIPAEYGGRLSSLLDVRLREGNSKQFELNGGIGLLFSRLSLQAPIVKDKSSFIIAGRRSYVDLFFPLLGEDFQDTRLSFYDLTAKVNYTINEKNKIYLSGYFGRDNIGFGDFAFNWGNATATLRWNHLFNDQLFLNTTVFYSNYDYSIGVPDPTDGFDWKANILNYSIKPEFTYFANSNNTINFGGQAILYQFRPGTAVFTSGGVSNTISQDDKFGLETAVYISNEQNIGKRITLQYGLRYSWFNYLGEGSAITFGDAPAGERRDPISSQNFGMWESIAQYGNLEPRFSAKYMLNDKSSLKLSYNRMAQYIHLVSNTTASIPLDTWTPSTNNIQPQLADQVALGYFRNFGKNNDYEFSAETYYKIYQNQIDYIDGADLLLNENLEGDLLSGDGRAYGLELYLKKNSGKLNGWISYTLARTEQQVDGINNNNWYPTRFDRTHNLYIVALYKLSKRVELSANFLYASGTPATFPTNRFEFDGIVVPHNAEDSRNNFRIAASHRLDLSLTLLPKKTNKRWQGSWVFSIYNVYANRNPFSVFFQSDADNPLLTQAVRFSVIGSLIPSVTYNFKF